jgi:AraC family transcriptional regulator
MTRGQPRTTCRDVQWRVTGETYLSGRSWASIPGPEFRPFSRARWSTLEEQPTGTVDKGGFMDSSVTSSGTPSGKSSTPANGEWTVEGGRPATQTINFLPNDIVRHQMGVWRGVHVETIQVISQERFEYSFRHTNHLLVAIEQGERHDGDIQLEGLPTSAARSCSHKLILVPAGRRFFGWQHPRQLTRSTCVYIDPRLIAVDPDCRFDEVDLRPRMLFEDIDLWQTVGKLKAQIGGRDPSSRLYAEALGGVLAHELLLGNGTIDVSKQAHRGGLAMWQQKRIVDFMEGHLAEDISLAALAGLVRLSPYHFVRSFKRSFGKPPHRYWTDRRIDRAKALLANPAASISRIALELGFGTISSFSATFRRVTGETPTNYRRGLL